jgi:hypothetical protein
MAICYSLIAGVRQPPFAESELSLTHFPFQILTVVIFFASLITGMDSVVLKKATLIDSGMSTEFPSPLFGAVEPTKKRKITLFVFADSACKKAVHEMISSAILSSILDGESLSFPFRSVQEFLFLKCTCVELLYICCQPSVVCSCFWAVSMPTKQRNYFNSK